VDVLYIHLLVFPGSLCQVSISYTRHLWPQGPVERKELVPDSNQCNRLEKLATKYVPFIFHSTQPRITMQSMQMLRASINELPVEVLANIFEGLVERETRQLSPQTFRSYLYGIPKGYPPILFLQVCRYWREVALSTPSLWASLSGRRLYYGYSSRPSPTIPAMRYWLDR
jgi:hypothetical protein